MYSNQEIANRMLIISFEIYL